MKKSFEAYFLGSRAHSGQASKWRLLLYFLFISDIFAVAYIGDTFATGFLAARYAMYGAVLAFTSGMLAIRTRISFAQLANLFIAVCLLIVAILSLFSGMIFSMVFPWFVLIPVMATLLLSERSGWIWLLVSLLAIAILIVLEGTG